MAPSEGLEGRNILITGAGSPRGQGVAEARHLVTLGAHVVIADIQDDAGHALAEEIGCRYAHLDVSRPDDWSAALDIACADGPLWGLVNNAAVHIPRHLADATVDEFELHMRVNQLGPFLGMKLGAPRMTGGGSIVNISSTAGLRGYAREIAYVGTKWALRGMTKAAAVDLGPAGIRVNSVHPGPISTDMLGSFSPEQRRQRAASVPLGREGSVEEVAELVTFLLSPRSSYVSGAEVAIDGGVTL